jgi:phosphatidylglycerol---prolipoprotein diacylglyceryl transferase
MMSATAQSGESSGDTSGVGKPTRDLGYTHPTVPIAVVTFQFDPFAQLLGDVAVRWGTIALVVVIVVALVLAALSARAGGLRPDDVAFVAIGIVPGAVIGGRLGYLILHQGYYGGALERLLDPAVGGLELGLAVVGGFLSGAYVASLLGGTVGRWLHLAAAPLLFALGAGKLTMVLTGAGQGQPSLEPWATAYLGAGPWGSLLPALPSIPAQAIEGGATLATLAILTVILALGTFGRRDGSLFFTAIGLWAVARAVVSTTWRDPLVTGRLNAGGLVAVAIALACGIALLVLAARRHRTAAPAGDAEGQLDVGWPDPETRPPF